MNPLKLLLFAIICLYATVIDVQKRINPSWIQLVLLIIGLMDYQLSALWGGIVTIIPLFVVAMFTKGGFGGGDVKFSGACGFVLQGLNGLQGVILGMILALAGYPLYRKILNTEQRGIPAVPFISIGCIIAGIFLL